MTRNPDDAEPDAADDLPLVLRRAGELLARGDQPGVELVQRQDVGDHVARVCAGRELRGDGPERLAGLDRDVLELHVRLFTTRGSSTAVEGEDERSDDERDGCEQREDDAPAPRK